jgi:hypothetical protein
VVLYLRLLFLTNTQIDAHSLSFCSENTPPVMSRLERQCEMAQPDRDETLLVLLQVGNYWYLGVVSLPYMTARFNTPVSHSRHEVLPRLQVSAVFLLTISSSKHSNDAEETSNDGGGCNETCLLGAGVPGSGGTTDSGLAGPGARTRARSGP